MDLVQSCHKSHKSDAALVAHARIGRKVISLPFLCDLWNQIIEKKMDDDKLVLLLMIIFLIIQPLLGYIILNKI